MKVAIGNDHAAIQLKEDILNHLLGKKTDEAVKESKIKVGDFGARDKESMDYPDYAWEICNKVRSSEFNLGILICGTGAGMCIAANKIRGIRAVVCSDPYTAQLARAHNDANVLCIGSRVVGNELAKYIVDAFIKAPFEGGRHGKRVEKIMELEDRD